MDKSSRNLCPKENIASNLDAIDPRILRQAFPEVPEGGLEGASGRVSLLKLPEGSTARDLARAQVAAGDAVMTRLFADQMASGALYHVKFVQNHKSCPNSDASLLGL